MTPTLSEASGIRRLVGVAGLLATWLMSGTALGQSWVGGRSAPTPGQLVAVDETGENGWLYGSEDVAGDGLDEFLQQERSIDIRTGYAATTSTEFFFRLYVSDTAPPGGNVSAFAFIDVDRNGATGGSAVAPEIDDRFASDASRGGYEYVFAVQGDGSVLDLWQWNEAENQYEAINFTPNQADAESGSDRDPITARSVEHGYLQGMVELNLVGLDQNCAANLYFRSLNETAALGDGDLEVGQLGACRPSDANRDGVPDVLVPDDRCSEDDACPVNSICIEGRCVFTGVCEEDADCDADEECNGEGYCVARAGDACSENAECETRLCSADQCARCSQDSQCAEGWRCAADGRCVSPESVGGGDEPTLELNAGDEVQGGACTCGVVGQAGAQAWWLIWLPVPALIAWRRRK